MPDLEGQNLVRRLTLITIVISMSFLANAQQAKRPLFILAKCDGKLSSVVLSSLKDAAKASEKYELVLSLNDNERLDLVQTIHLTCAENKDVTAIASQFGIAKCKSTTVCHSAIDGLSLNVALCNANLSVDCGHAIFKAFDTYINRPNPTPLNVD